MMKRLFVFIFVLSIMLTISNGTGAVFGETSAARPSAFPGVASDSAALMDLKTGKLLFDKASHKKEYPASLTKILTALLALDDLDLNKTVTVGKEINLVSRDASGAGLSVGEKLTGKELIWALMLPSGNDAAYTAAVAVAREKSGKQSMDIEDALKYFSDLMNKRAQQIGARDSHFVNPDGYPDENHYSTAYDMALISAEAMKNDFFKEVADTYSYDIKPGSTFAKGSKATVWYNKNQLLNPKSKYYYQYATGIKTGSTTAAGYCLASSAAKDGIELIAVVMKAGNEEQRCVDSKNLFNYGFDNFKYATLLKKGEKVGELKIARKYFGGGVTLDAVSDGEYTGIISNADASKVKLEVQWDSKLAANDSEAVGVIADAGMTQASGVTLMGPISKGQVLGKVSLVLDGKVLAQADVLAASDALKGDLTDKVVNALDFIIKYQYPAIAGAAVIVLVFVILAVAFRRKSAGRR